MSDEFETVFEHSTYNRADGPSKSQKKRDAKALQDLGVDIMAQKVDFIRDLDLPAELAQALLDGQTMERGARKRQIKYIGRLLRDIDVAPVQTALASLHEESAEDVRAFQSWEPVMTPPVRYIPPPTARVTSRGTRAATVSAKEFTR